MEEKVFDILPKIRQLLYLLLITALLAGITATITGFLPELINQGPTAPTILTAAAMHGLPGFDNNSGNKPDGLSAGEKPTATVAAVKMNVLYTGIDNPISVAIPGVRPDQLLVSSSGATVSGSLGQYNVRVPSGVTEVTINATAKGSNAGGGVKFRVRPLPRPVVAFGTINTPTASIAAVRAATLVQASLGEGFVFEGIGFTVTKYSFMHVPRRGIPTALTVNGCAISPQIKALYNSMNTGDQVIIYDVRAKGPAGEVMLTTSVLLTIR
jgi:hypothetical protein